MKTLKTIQTTCNVFRILAKAVMILSFVWAGLAAAGIICTIALKNGAAGLSAETMLFLTDSSTIAEMIGVLVADLVFGLADGILFLFVYRYFQREIADGTPFTAEGAGQLKQLGIKTIILPLVSSILAEIIYSACGVECKTDFSNGSFVVLGIVMILFALVLRSGAEMMENNIQRLPAERNNMK